MITIGIAILLSCGFVAGKICQKLSLPAVTGYILAGLLLGPTGVNLITGETIGHSLDHFTQIALMLIAFGIGEHIELHKLRKHTKSLLWIGICETTGALVSVSLIVYLTIRLTGFTMAGWEPKDYIALSLLLGAVGVATAPAATLLVIRELKAKGPLTSTLMAIVAIDDGLAIMLFGLVVSVTHQFLGQSNETILLSVFSGLFEIFSSIVLGVLTGYVLIFFVNRLRESGEIMTAGLAILLLCSEAAIYFHLSPLLAGMGAGFILVNKAERDVRMFRELNKFEPPIYVLFFTLAGTHLDIQSLKTAGIIGFIYFFARILGKIAGVSLGAWIAGSIPVVRRYLGFALLPQAGVAIGLIFLLSSDPALAEYASIITPVVLAGVFLSELIGPVSARYSLTRAGEAYIEKGVENTLPLAEEGIITKNGDVMKSDGFELVPWTWQKLTPPKHPKGFIVFHGEDPATSRGLARIATILASYYHALPMAVQILARDKNIPKRLFYPEHDEVHNMGYTLATELVHDHDLASGLVTAAEYYESHLVVLAYPLEGDEEDFNTLLHTVTHHVFCPVAVIRFSGEIHTERILLPISDIEELISMYPVIAALNGVGEHQLNIRYMMSSTAQPRDLVEKEKEIKEWLEQFENPLNIDVTAIPTESRFDIINQHANDTDIIVMIAEQKSGVQRILFGSLVDSVARRIKKTLIVLYNSEKDPADIPDR